MNNREGRDSKKKFKEEKKKGKKRTRNGFFQSLRKNLFSYFKTHPIKPPVHQSSLSTCFFFQTEEKTLTLPFPPTQKKTKKRQEKENLLEKFSQLETPHT